LLSRTPSTEERLAEALEQLDEANETIRWLRAAIAPLPVCHYRGLRLSPSEYCLLDGLYEAGGAVLSNEMLRRRLDVLLGHEGLGMSVDSVDVVACRLGQKLRRLNPSVDISRMRARGWFLTSEMRERLGAIRYNPFDKGHWLQRKRVG
jgi:DNA-binding response OmpR family regulator